jgi:exodeoxyribonuclease V alpha subunit
VNHSNFQTTPDKVTIEGLIDRITYQNPENGFSILKCKIPKHSELVPVVGHSNSISVGEHFRAEGSWGYHREYGRQFKAERPISFPPNTVEGLEKYLNAVQ